MKTVLKVVLGMVLGAVVLVAGCAALVGGAASEVDKNLKQEQNANAITNKQARAVSLGTTRREAEQTLGAPRDMQESENSGLGKDSHLLQHQGRRADGLVAVLLRG